MSFTVFSNWTQFHFAPSHKAFDVYENVLSPSTVSGMDIKWSYPAKGYVYSSPAIVNGILYAGSLDDNMYSIKVSTGALLWQRPTGARCGLHRR